MVLVAIATQAFLAESSSLWLIVVGILASVLGLVLWMQQWWRRTRHQGRGRRSRWGERQARAILKRAGFAILDEQVHRTWQLEVDGLMVDASCRADFLVERRKSRYIADVKTGKMAINPVFPATRRQLLEYAHVYRDIDGLLLIDMEHRRVIEVAFPERSDES